MEDKTAIVASLFEKIKEYLDSGFELYKLKTIDKVSEIFSTVALRVALFIVFSVFFLFLNTGIAVWLGEISGKLYYGFFIVASFYLIALVVVFLFSNKIKSKISGFIITQSLK